MGLPLVQGCSEAKGWPSSETTCSQLLAKSKGKQEYLTLTGSRKLRPLKSVARGPRHSPQRPRVRLRKDFQGVILPNCGIT